MRLTLTLPNTWRNWQAHVAIANQMALEFGGVTSYDARGIWYNDDGKLVQDQNTVYESFVTAHTPYVRNEIARNMYEIAEIAHTQLPEEDAIFYTIDNDHYTHTLEP